MRIYLNKNTITIDYESITYLKSSIIKLNH